MFATVDGLRVRYEMSSGTGRPVLFLHGWGCSADTFLAQIKLAEKSRRTLVFDFPGFGQSDEPPSAFTVYDYAALTEKLMTELGVDRPDVVAHSFGARVALILAARGKIGRLLITGGAGMKPRRGPRYAVKVALYKLKKRLGTADGNSGSPDYRALSDGMKRVFVGVVNTHLESELDKIGCPVLLVWGERDRETPMYMARRMKRGIRDCGLAVLADAGHFAFLDRPEGFAAIAQAFFAEERL